MLFLGSIGAYIPRLRRATTYALSDTCDDSFQVYSSIQTGAMHHPSRAHPHSYLLPPREMEQGLSRVLHPPMLLGSSEA